MTSSDKAHCEDNCCGLCRWHREDVNQPSHDVHCILTGEEKCDTETCKNFIKHCECGKDKGGVA